MICEKCRNKCDICGDPLFPQKGIYPGQPWYEPNKIWCDDSINNNKHLCGDVPNNKLDDANFLSMLVSKINDSNLRG